MSAALTAVLRDFPVGVVLDGTVLPLNTTPYRAFLDEVKQRGVSYHRIARGTHLDLQDGVMIDALSPPRIGYPFGTKRDNGTINNYSCVLRVSYGATRILLDGDAQSEAEADMLATYAPSDLRCDVLKAGHHGSRNASTGPHGWQRHVQVQSLFLVAVIIDSAIPTARCWRAAPRRLRECTGRTKTGPSRSSATVVTSPLTRCCIQRGGQRVR